MTWKEVDKHMPCPMSTNMNYFSLLQKLFTISITPIPNHVGFKKGNKLTKDGKKKWKSTFYNIQTYKGKKGMSSSIFILLNYYHLSPSNVMVFLFIYIWNLIRLSFRGIFAKKHFTFVTILFIFWMARTICPHTYRQDKIC